MKTVKLLISKKSNNQKWLNSFISSLREIPGKKTRWDMKNETKFILSKSSFLWPTWYTSCNSFLHEKKRIEIIKREFTTFVERVLKVSFEVGTSQHSKVWTRSHQHPGSNLVLSLIQMECLKRITFQDYYYDYHA